MISLIYAIDKNGLIGDGNSLPWNLPNDLKYFKEVTHGKVVVMGRKTFESIGKPLPNRINIILTTKEDYSHPKLDKTCVITSNFNHILLYSSIKDIFIIGGSEIFKLFIPFTHKIYATKIDSEFKGDTYIPQIDFNKYILEKQIEGVVDKKNVYKHTFEIYKKKGLKLV